MDKIRKSYENLIRYSRKWRTEAEVRQYWLQALNEATNQYFSLEKDWNDASYNDVIIEFKAPGLFKESDKSAKFIESIKDRIVPYTIRKARLENGNISDYLGIVIDGMTLAFVQLKSSTGEYKTGQLLPLNFYSYSMVVEAISTSKRRSLTSQNIIDDFGHKSDIGIALMRSLAALLSKGISDEQSKVNMLFEEWRQLYGQAADLPDAKIDEINSSLNFEIEIMSELKIPGLLFVIHTYDSLLIKLLAAEILSSYDMTTYKDFAQYASIQDNDLLQSLMKGEIEESGLFSSANIKGFVEEVLFSWYLEEPASITNGVIDNLRPLMNKLSLYRTDKIEDIVKTDIFKEIYQNLVPDTLRKSLGEFYTPDWLADFTLGNIESKSYLDARFLDPACGSGTFVNKVIERKIKAYDSSSKSSSALLDQILREVWGFDLNPLAVQTARLNYLIMILDILKLNPGKEIEIPILLADAIYFPSQEYSPETDIVEYKVGSSIANLLVKLPEQIAFNRKLMDKVFLIFDKSLEKNLEYVNFKNEVDCVFKCSSTSESDALKETYNSLLELHRNNWNGIWTKIVKNYFWSASAGEFDFIVGNPPWVRWSKLPELYRERVKPTASQYDIFSDTPMYGGNELDISALLTYTVSDKWLTMGGTLMFLLPQNHLQTPSSQGFRSFKIDKTSYFNPIKVNDFKSLKPFPDAVNKTMLLEMKKESIQNDTYPVDYIVWDKKDGFSKTIHPNDNLPEVLEKTVRDSRIAQPVDKLNSPWIILDKDDIGKYDILSRKKEQLEIAGRKGITTDLNGVFFVNIVDFNKEQKQVQIKNNPDLGKKKIGPQITQWVETDMLYPLIKGASDFSPCFVRPKRELYTFVPNIGINKLDFETSELAMEKLELTSKYFSRYSTFLKDRSTYKLRMKKAPEYCVYNVGHYTFTTWKVIWAEQKKFCAAVVGLHETDFLGSKPYIPDHKLYFVETDDEELAYFICGLLNSDLVVDYVNGHNVNIQIGNVFKHMSLPSFEPSNISHKQLVRDVKAAHNEPDDDRRETLLKSIRNIGKKILA